MERFWRTVGRSNGPTSMSDIAAFRASLIAFLLPATAEPHISCTIVGSAEFLERDPGGRWLTHHIRRGDIFVTRSRTPYEVRFRSPAGEELETIAIHVGIDSFRDALEAIYPGNASEVANDTMPRMPVQAITETALKSGRRLLARRGR